MTVGKPRTKVRSHMHKRTGTLLPSVMKRRAMKRNTRKGGR